MNSTRVFKAEPKPSAYQMRRAHGRNFPGGVADTADRLADRQAKSWLGSKSIGAHHKRRTAAEKLARHNARSERDKEFRSGRQTKKG